MEFLQSYWLWGILAVVVPVAIHFWNQKKGKTIEWAASRWLSDKNTLNHRGIQLHEIPLMLIRCLLIILLALILAKPVMDWLKNAAGTHTVHMVQPNKLLVDNYRFELENALKKGEKIYWIGPEVRQVDTISQIPSDAKSALYLQQSLNKLELRGGSKVKLYLMANQDLLDLSRIYVPAPFELYPMIDSSNKKEEPLKFDRDLHVLVDYKNETEQETIEAALSALTNVRQFPFSIDLKSDPKKKYDWILTDSLVKPIDSQALFLVSGKVTSPGSQPNVIQIPDSLKLASSAIVENGRLPEFLGEQLIKHLGMIKYRVPLSNRQLHSLFVRTKPIQDAEAGQMRKWLLLLFVLTALLERWISLRKNQVSTYA